MDEHNNAPVCCQTSNNIHVMKAGGTKHKVLTSEPDGIKSQQEFVTELLME